MAIFEGTIREFHTYLGPRIRNAVNLFARRERLARGGVCEDCGRAGQTLQSAHVHGKGRRTIIEAVLSDYAVEDGVRCDLAAVEKKILDTHGPVAEAFKFLCDDCHRRYDEAAGTPALPVHPGLTGHDLVPPQGNGKFDLRFDPAPEALFKAELLNAKRAYVTLHKTDGRIETKIWNAANFSATSNLRNNLGSGYLRNARARGIIGAVFSITPPPPVSA